MRDMVRKKLWRLNNLDRERMYKKRSRLKNPEAEKATQKRYYLKNRKRKVVYNQEWQERNREHYRNYLRRWREENPERYLEYHRKWYLKKRQYPEFRVLGALRRRLRGALNALNKSKATQELLGCALEDFRLHIESLWEPGMSWENYGKWHLDHMIPCALFDLSRPEHQRRCFHFSNIRPMWAIANIKKGKKLITNQYNLI